MKNTINEWRRVIEGNNEFEESHCEGDFSYEPEDYRWLMEQAERVEELEKENDELAERVHKLALDWSELVDERNRYKQALAEILNVDCNLEGLDAERELDRVTDIALKALEGEELKTLVSVTFNGSSSEHIFDVPKDEFKVMWNEQIEQVGYFESIDTEGRTVIINPKQCPVIVMYDLND